MIIRKIRMVGSIYSDLKVRIFDTPLSVWSSPPRLHFVCLGFLAGLYLFSGARSLQAGRLKLSLSEASQEHTDFRYVYTPQPD